MVIAFLDAMTLGDVDFKRFEELGEVRVYTNTFDDELEARIKNVDVIVTNKVVLDKKALDITNAKFIQVAATGMNNVDVEYAKKKGIIVKNVEDYSTKSVAQHTFALVLGLINKIKYFDNYTRNFYPESHIFTHIKDWFEINGKRWGIVGLGKIGKEVAKIAEAFGAEVVYYSTSGKNRSRKYKRVEFDELLKSDIITIHAPLNDKTKDLFTKKELMQLKKGAILVNVGRGGIINERDLVDVLDRKDIYVGLDVYSKEPVGEDNPILRYDSKTLLTPHIAWTSIEARERLINKIYENIKDFVNKN